MWEKCLSPIDIAENNDREAHINFHITNSISYFDGHFPDSPVLPAVAYIEICQFFLDMLNLELGPGLEVKRSKFLKPLGPNTQVQLTLKKGEKSFTFIWQTEGEQVAKIELVKTQ